MRIGLIINPIAGIGGRVGLKGSDEAEIQRKSIELGAERTSHLRAEKALSVLSPLKGQIELSVAAGEMGENLALWMGFEPVARYDQVTGRETTAADTIRAARRMLEAGTDLILFCGGDGTARDICSAVGTQTPVLGIPAGVKMYSGVFASRPEAAGELAAAMIRGERIGLKEAEVVDLDEESYRAGRISTRLYGTIRVPYRRLLLQNQKAPAPASEPARLEAIAAAVIDQMEPDHLYILGPGTTTRAVAEKLGFPKTLVGVDVYTRQGVIALDVNERRLMELIEARPARIVVTPTGGSGFLFGRGNQQIAPSVIRKLGRENIIVISQVEKINSLQGEPLLVDTGDSETDRMLAGYIQIITGYAERIVYPVAF